MEHVVFFPAADGTPAFRRVTSREEAVRFVEHLRNIEGVADFSVHSLEPVPLSFRAYYRVEVPDESDPLSSVTSAGPAPVAVVDAPAPEPAAPSEPSAVDSVPVEAAAESESGPDSAPADEARVEQPGVPVPAPVAAAAELHEVPAPAQSVEDDVVEHGRKSLGFFAR